MISNSLKLTLQKEQGNLFAEVGKLGFDSEIFIKGFMKSSVAEGLDADFDFMQWCGRAYMLNKLLDEYPDIFVKSDNVYDSETLFWIGYTYRYWNYYTNDTSKKIVKIAPPKVMNESYFILHTFDCKLAVDTLKEEYENKYSKV